MIVSPEYIKARISIKREELIAWLQTEQGEWINADIKVSQGGKWYAAVDDWKPNGQGGQQRQGRPPSRPQPAAPAPDDGFEDSIPF